MTEDAELLRLESRWRVVAAVVLVLTGVAVVAGIAWVPKQSVRLNGLWDLLYGHHRQLVILLAAAVILLGLVAAVAWRRSSLRLLTWGAFPLVVITLVVGGWVIADRRSNAGDIEGRVHDVTAVLPSQAVRTAVTQGDNFLDESYVIDDDVGSVATSIWTSARERLGRSAGVWADAKEGDSPMYVSVSFTGRNGCDGSVDVSVVLSVAEGATTARVAGSCED